MEYKKIIPCLDTKGGRVVKGVNFKGLRDIGDPAEIAKKYQEQGADELVILDITATNQRRKTMLELVQRCADAISIPFTVGGGIASVSDFEAVLLGGASRASINSAAVKNKKLIAEVAKEFGSAALVVAIDVRKSAAAKSGYTVMINGGELDACIDALDFAKEAAELGAGQLLLTSMEGDGTLGGYDIEVTKMLAQAVAIPVIASGGAGCREDILRVFRQTGCAAALAASIFHDGTLTVSELKKYLAENGIGVCK